MILRLRLVQINEEFDCRLVPIEMLCSKEKIDEFNIGPGDEVFIAGRFVHHEGTQKNLPTARFGNIAMLPHEPIRHGRGHLQESFLVECRSLAGYSGSPVFLFCLPLVWDNVRKQPNVPIQLLGLDWGHLHDLEPLIDKAATRINGGRKVKVNPNWAVESNTGMACVVPAWKILELLNMEDFVKKREEGDEALGAEKASSPVTLDSQTPCGDRNLIEQLR